VRPDALTDADMAGRPAFRPRRLRILGRMFLRSVGILPLLPAVDETNTEHGSIQSRRVCGRYRLVSQEPFVCVAVATEAVADSSDLVST
jgi:hypothetical protein